MTTARCPVAILSERVVPPERVYVRTQGARTGDRDFFGEVTHRATLAGMTLSLSVRVAGTDSHIGCEPHWVHPFRDMAALFNLPRDPLAPQPEA